MVTYFTLRNVEEVRSFPIVEESTYFVAGEEYTSTHGKKHWQMYMRFPKLVTRGEIMGAFPGCHAEIPRRGPQECAEYCKKDGTFQEFGTLPEKRKYVKKPAKELDLIVGEADASIAIKTDDVGTSISDHKNTECSVDTSRDIGRELQLDRAIDLEKLVP